MIDLEKKIQYLKGVGPKMCLHLNKLGLETVRDLIFYYPRTYKDFTNITKISEIGNTSYDAQNQDSITIRGRVLGISNKKTSRRRFTVTEAVVEDGTGSIKVIWFNQPFLLKMLPAGREVILNGKITYNFYSREVVMESPDRTLYPRIEAIYGETAGLTSRYISKLVASVKESISNIPEYLPEDLLCRPEFISGSQREGMLKRVQHDKLLGIQEALLNIHFPKSSEMLERARRRIAFDELFMISLRANLSKEEIKKENAPVIADDSKQISDSSFVEELPFCLTSDQEKSVHEILKDMAKDVPMNRLLNGDVGSGKTAVVAVAAYVAVKAGFRVALMVPTSILASQHFETFCKLFKKFDITIGLFTRERQEYWSRNNNQETRNKQIPNSKLKGSKLTTDNCILTTDIIIGTQALIQEGIQLNNMGLVIVDEQHRFGVAQRAALQQLTITKIQDTRNKQISNSKIKGSKLTTAQKMRPHFLSMTATPIPRTLHLSLFGDLDISIIKEKPANRKEIKTRFVEPKNRDRAYEFIRAHIKAGRQAFVICPLIEENTDDSKQITELFDEDRKSVKVEYEKLQKVFPELKIGMLHGKMKAKEKDAVMEEFCNNRLNILVSTSVVEVGVDVPNATVIVIEDAERFGLAQIHQFRGRVGRAEHQSFCFLFSPTRSEKAISRLKALEATSDGFKLAEIDLEQRGPGAVFGTEQSGMLDLKMANFSDRELIEQASTAAKLVVKNDPELKNHPLLKEKVADYLVSKHME